MSDVDDPASESVRRLVSEIDRAHGLRFTLGARCRGGLQGGAWMLSDAGGRHAVLKWRANDPKARTPGLVPIVDRIRAAGYPTPRWIAAGVTPTGTSYHVQEFVVGRPATPLTAETAAVLIDVLERQAGLDPDPGHDWRGYVSSVVLEDGNDGSRAFLRELGHDGRGLLAHFDRVLAAHGPVRLPGGDMVHGDFNSCNVLMRDGQLRGVIDIEAFGSGTRVIDYAWLLREAYVVGDADAVPLIRRAGEAVAGPGALALCVAATAFTIVRFQAHHDPRSLPWVLERLHHLADDLAR